MTIQLTLTWLWWTLGAIYALGLLHGWVLSRIAGEWHWHDWLAVPCWPLVTAWAFLVAAFGR